MKGALLLHGWATDKHVWHRYWLLDNEAPMADMLEEEGFEPIFLEMPGLYLDQDKDFNWYARFLGHIIREREDLDEVMILGHSMGGIVSRMYMQLRDDIFDEGKLRVSRIISLGTPNHGTSQPHFDTISTYLLTIAGFVVPWKKGIAKGEGHDYFLKTPCYRDIQLGSDFLLNLNNDRIPDHAEHHVIWTNGDTVADPPHTCILPGAANHLIDRVMVNHFNMCYRKEVVNRVRSIIRNEANPTGLQTYPPVHGCAHVAGHIWLPDPSLGSRDSLNVWKCSFCGETTVCHALPLQFSCKANGRVPPLHKWSLSGRFQRYRFRCQRCRKTIWFPEVQNSGLPL